jgi:dynein heavy chain
MGKLKRFLTMVKFQMQDTLLFLTIGSVHRFTESLKTFLPLGVEIVDAFNVNNKFITDDEEKSREDDPYASKDNPLSLFAIDLILETG